MCEKCDAIDGKIARYRKISEGITDQPTLDGIDKLIAEMKAEKSALHPERSK